MLMYALIGLVVIILAWWVQLFTIKADNKKFNKLFIVLYCIGVVFLVLDSYYAGLHVYALLNLVSLIFAFMVLVRLFLK
jgi:hypothetical protein